MKKEYIYCITSLVLLSLGITFSVAALLAVSLSWPSKSVLAVFGTCFILIGIISYAEHNKKYLKIKDLMSEDAPLMARWTFSPNYSRHITELLYTKKFSAYSTTMLMSVFCLVIACCIYLSGEAYSAYIASVLILISPICTAIALIVISSYYDSKMTEATEALIGEESIYFIDDLHTLQKSIYFLQDVRIDYGRENTLQFLYGDYNLYDDPVYVVNIPIPEGELKRAEFVQKHYLDLIHYDEETE